MPCYNTAPYKRLKRVLCRQCSFYTAHAIKQHAGLYRRFSRNLYRSDAADTRPTQADIIPPAPRWSVSQHRSTSSAYQDTNAPPGRCTGQHSHPIIIRYIKGQRCAPVMDPCQTVQHRPCQPGGGQLLPSADRWQVLRPAHLLRGQPGGLQSGTLHPAGQSSGKGAAGGAALLAATAASLFGLSPDSQ